MSSFAVTHANSVLSYSAAGRSNTAQLRCNGIPISYGLNSEESHARQHRAFYPHRRSQGSFSLRFECKGWIEANQLATWLREYARVVLDLSATDVPPPMTVSVPSRDFLRLGIPRAGITFGDHLGSMVFTPTITFVSVSDPQDASTGILRRSQASTALYRSTDPAAASFYPEQAIKRPGKLGDQIYNQALNAALLTSQQLQDLIQATTVNPVRGRNGMSEG